MRRRRLLLLVTSSALLLGGLTSVSTAVAQAPAAGGGRIDPHLLVHKTPDGRSAFLGSTDGRVLDPGSRAASPADAARAHLKTIAPTLGIGAPGRNLVTGQVLSLKAGGSVVRFDQQVGGVPVFGGQVVMNLDSGNGLTSVLSHVSAATSVAAAKVPTAAAQSAAVAATVDAESVDPSTLQVTGTSLVVFDPTVVDTMVAGPARPAWQVTVAGGPAIDELVLVDARTGSVILRFNQVDSVLNRKICDNVGTPQSSDVPCTTPVLSEGGSPTASTDVNDAYTFLGETAQAYSDIAGIDLTSMIGINGQLRATVDWCYTGLHGCPFDNAFWSGTEMYFGAGFAAADDVVAHELTHGVTDHTSNLFYFAQSGAMNESFSDVFGEIVDHRYGPTNEPVTWTMGEDLPGGAIRSLQDPTSLGDPDRMTSPLYVSSGDSDGVHSNSGVGNKTFYLISQGTTDLPGGSFDGVTSTGIDGNDTTLAKSALLYYRTLVSLTSGSEYADLGVMLQQQCGDLATAGTLGFTTDDCTQVADAVQATQLAQSPLGKSAQPADPAIGCPMGTEEQILFDGEATTKNFRTSSWWTRAPNLAYGIPSNERSAGGSWAGVDFFKNAKSSFKGAVDVKLPAGQKSYLRFAQWYSFAYQGTWYPHGGSVSLLRKTSSGYKSVDIASKAWVNGPNHKITGAGVRGFGGDSHGWYTSRASLTSLAGKKIRPVFTTYGENVGNYSPYIAWYLDDIQVYTCRPFTPPSAVTAFDGAIGGTDAQPDVTLTWAAPTDLGEGFTGYLVGGAGAQQTLATDATSVTFSGLDPTRQYTLWVRPLGKEGVLGPRRTFLAGAPVTSLSLEYPKVKKSQLPRLDGRVSSAGPIPFRVEFRRVRSSTWKPLPWPAGGPEIVWSTDKKGRFWATYDRPRHPIVIRVVFDIGPHTFAGSSPEVTQRLG